MTAGTSLVILGALGWMLRPGTAERYSGSGTGVDGLTRNLERALPDDAPAFQFVDVAEETGISFAHFPGTRSSRLTEDMGSGAAWGDYDGDGDADLYLVNFVPAAGDARSALYRNDGGRFTDVTEEAGLINSERGSAAAWGDYNSDGILDLWTSAVGFNRLWIGLDGSRFKEPISVGPEGFWAGVSPGDYDRDGDLDVYVSGYVLFRDTMGAQPSLQYQSEQPASLNPSAFEPERNLLFQNDGRGRFREVAVSAGVSNPAGRSLSASWADFDSDGWLDLYVANDVSDNSLFLSNGDGTFHDFSHASGSADYRGAMGLGVGDWDGDGDQDLFVTHWIAQENAFFDNLLGESAFGLRFTDLSSRIGLGQSSLDFVGWATSFADFDLDGRQDLFVLNGSTFQDRDDPTRLVPMTDLLYWNGGADRGFFETGGLGELAAVSRGGAVSDFDGDGDLDILAVDLGGPARLLSNDTPTGNWLKVRLTGPSGNTAGLGSVIDVWADGVLQRRQVGSQSGYLSQNDPVEIFGLGEAAGADSVVVRWLAGEEVRSFEIPRGVRLDVSPTGFTVHDPGAERTAGSAPAQATSDRQSTVDFWAAYREATTRRLANDLRGASRAYTAALALRPDHEDALYYGGSILAGLGQWEQADSLWRQLVRVNPRSSRGLTQLGSMRLCGDDRIRLDPEGAYRYFEAAHQINPVETGTMTRLGYAALAWGDLPLATEWFDRVLASDPGSVPARVWRRYASGNETTAGTGTAPEQATGLSGEGDTKEGGALLGSRAGCPRFDSVRTNETSAELMARLSVLES